MKVAVCNAKDCGARMLWAVTINGKRMPLDAEPLEGDVGKITTRDVVLVKRAESDDPLALSVSHIAANGVIVKLIEQGVAFYRDHHATCASPDDFRDTPL